MARVPAKGWIARGPGLPAVARAIGMTARSQAGPQGAP
ncbi:hypothetical protein FHS87_003139 [Roseomonas pecuniae]|uniref:Uncharacterized protein n=1 Tax=Muricoccus pecuniae TaxID=693023 RepID=A0A840Y2X3_9PROT|nr:hypothetical protein [Roseomonas pecuniae]